jgi:hypothetical protein
MNRKSQWLSLQGFVAPIHSSYSHYTGGPASLDPLLEGGRIHK